MKILIATSCLALSLAVGSGVAQAAECGDVTIANMNWQSAEVLANIDKFILSNGYDCNADLVIGDTVPTITSMVEKGQPDIAPEAWIDLMPDVVNRGLQEGTIIGAANAISDGGIQGWWIPKYFADAYPDIKTYDDVFKHPELFPAPEDSEKGAIINGPQGWGAAVVTAQLFKAFNGEKAGFMLVDTGSAAGLDGAIAKAYERKLPIVTFYWGPTALLGKYEMIQLDPGIPHDAAEWKRCNTVAECPDPKRNGWPVDRIKTLVTKKFGDRAGPTLEYLNTRSWTNQTVNRLLAWMTENQATGEDGAKYFLKNNESIWTEWVSPDVAEKVKAAL